MTMLDNAGENQVSRSWLLSSNAGGAVFLLLAFAGIIDLGLFLKDPDRRAAFLGPRLTRLLFRQPAGQGPSQSQTPCLPRRTMIKRGAINLVHISFLYVFMEWVFQITKPSFMNSLSLVEKLNVLLVTGLGIAAAISCTFLVLFLLDAALTLAFPSLRRYLYYIPAAFLAACLCLLLLDNFTYTVVGKGVVDSKTWLRVVYALVFGGLFAWFLRRMAFGIRPFKKRAMNRIIEL